MLGLIGDIGGLPEGIILQQLSLVALMKDFWLKHPTKRFGASGDKERQHVDELEHKLQEASALLDGAQSDAALYQEAYEQTLEAYGCCERDSLHMKDDMQGLQAALQLGNQQQAEKAEACE